MELLDLQLREANEREENIKRMHDTMMNALKTDSNSAVSLKVRQLVMIYDNLDTKRG